jgi:hypothetical protein
MRVKRAFRIAGRARCVAKKRCRAFVEDRPRIVAVASADQRFVAERGRGHIGEMGADAGLVAERNPALHVRTLRRDDVHQRGERHVERDVFVVGVIDDERHLIGKEPRIDRVADGAHPGHAEITFQVAIPVPRQCANAFARLHTQPDQRLRQLFRALFAIAPSIAMNVAFNAARDNLGIAEMACSVG